MYEHDPTDAALFNQPPFIIRPPASDTSATNRAKYVAQQPIAVGGVIQHSLLKCINRPKYRADKKNLKGRRVYAERMPDDAEIKRPALYPDYVPRLYAGLSAFMPEITVVVLEYAWHPHYFSSNCEERAFEVEKAKYMLPAHVPMFLSDAPAPYLRIPARSPYVGTLAWHEIPLSQETDIDRKAYVTDAVSAYPDLVCARSPGKSFDLSAKHYADRKVDPSHKIELTIGNFHFKSKALGLY
jgi:hypothetical protein